MKHDNQSVHIVPASQAKINFGELLKRVYENDEPQIIERAGMPVAAVISISDFQKFYPQLVQNVPNLEEAARRLQASKEINIFLDKMQQGGEKFTEEEVYEDVLNEVMAMRRERRMK